jgi:hypothetical protein
MTRNYAGRVILLVIIGVFGMTALPAPTAAQEETPVIIDTDGDGITDAVDACPDLFGVIAFSGCSQENTDPEQMMQSDSDGDGLVDSADDCPTEFGSLQERGCMMRPPSSISDTDGDGIIDADDACPTTYALTADGCAAPGQGGGGGATFTGISDSDGDGLVDTSDTCPFEFALTASGCLDAGQGGGQQPPVVVVEPPAPPVPAPASGCPGSLPPRLEVGMEGQIVSTYSTLRETPNGTPIQRMLNPDTFVVVEGPVCYLTLTYYRIDYGDGLVGWALESQRFSIYGEDRYWLEPR